MFDTDPRSPMQCYQERVEQSAQERLALALLRTQRHAATPARPPSWLPRVVRLFVRRAAAGQA